MPLSYKDTLGFAESVICATEWTSAAGKRTILRLVRARLFELAAAESVDSSVIEHLPLLWNDELQHALSNLVFPPGFTRLNPIPSNVADLAEHVALTYFTRIRMHHRLDAMRAQTSVALVPRGATDEDAHKEEGQLRFVLPSNKALFRRYRNHLATFTR